MNNSTLIIALGSNLGDSKNILKKAIKSLSEHYKLQASSRLYYSKAVDYENQPQFLNQVAQFTNTTHDKPESVLNKLLEIEALFGRTREILRGPRTLDLDLLFYDLITHRSERLILPHPRLFERSFVVRPLKEIPFFEKLQEVYTFPDQFAVEAYPLP